MEKDNEYEIIVKNSKHNFIKDFIKLLTLTTPNKVLPISNELYEIEDKINNCKTEFTDDVDDDCASTVALTSNPSSFASNESAEEYFSKCEYNRISVLGSGSFGTVYLTEHKDKIYAVKSLPKIKINKGELEQILLEKQILMQMSDPFTLKLLGTYQTKNELCFITEAIEHGDLFQAIYDGDRLSHEACVFYASCILLGLDYIHRKNIVYRDLKPENIMIGENGYPKIIDFGLAKQLPYMKLDNGIMTRFSKCYTLCGTPEYVAPELILGKSYDYGIDIWAFGVLLYEMICRNTPFIDGNKNKDISKTYCITQIFTNIVMCGKNGIELSPKVDRKTDGTPHARNLITQLLNGNVESRLGKNNTPKNLLSTPYFLSTGINADNLYNQTIEAPIIQPQYIGRDIETAPQIQEYDGDQDVFNNFAAPFW